MTKGDNCLVDWLSFRCYGTGEELNDYPRDPYSGTSEILSQIYGVDSLLKYSMEHVSRWKLGHQPNTRAPSLHMLKLYLYSVHKP